MLKLCHAVEQGDIAMTELSDDAELLVVSQLLGNPKHNGEARTVWQNGSIWSSAHTADVQ